MSKFRVITSSGLQVFAGNWSECYAYIMQALAKGSKPGYLKIVEKEEENDVLGQAGAGIPGHGAQGSG